MIITTHKTYKDLPLRPNPNQGNKEVKKRTIVKKVEKDPVPEDKEEEKQ